MKRTSLLFALFLSCIPFTNYAQSTSALTQIGVAQFSQLRRPFYIGGLYAEESTLSATELLSVGGQKKLEIKVLADKYSQRRFSMQWSQALIVNATQEELLAFDDALVKFQNILEEPFQKGDVISVSSDALGKSTIAINDISVFSVDRPGFLELLLSTWIGNKPPTTEFKQELLTASAAGDVKAAFDELLPSEERVSQIKQALSPKPAKQSNKPVLIETAAKPIIAEPIQNAPVVTALEKPKVAEIKPAIELSKPEPPTPTPSEEFEESEIDPELYRQQQQTLRMMYAKSATRTIQSQVKYPRSAMKRKQQGVVKVQVIINRQGMVETMQIVEQTEAKALNKAALAAVEEAGKLNAIPSAIDSDSVAVVIPFVFALQ